MGSTLPPFQSEEEMCLVKRFEQKKTNPTRTLKFYINPDVLNAHFAGTPTEILLVAVGNYQAIPSASSQDIQQFLGDFNNKVAEHEDKFIAGQWRDNPRPKMPIRVDILKGMQQQGMLEPILDESSALAFTEFPTTLIFGNNKRFLDEEYKPDLFALTKDTIVEGLLSSSEVKSNKAYYSVSKIRTSSSVAVISFVSTVKFGFRKDEGGNRPYSRMRQEVKAGTSFVKINVARSDPSQYNNRPFFMAVCHHSYFVHCLTKAGRPLTRSWPLDLDDPSHKDQALQESASFTAAWDQTQKAKRREQMQAVQEKLDSEDQEAKANDDANNKASGEDEDESSGEDEDDNESAGADAVDYPLIRDNQGIVCVPPEQFHAMQALELVKKVPHQLKYMIQDKDNHNAKESPEETIRLGQNDEFFEYPSDHSTSVGYLNGETGPIQYTWTFANVNGKNCQYINCPTNYYAHKDGYIIRSNLCWRKALASGFENATAFEVIGHRIGMDKSNRTYFLLTREYRVVETNLQVSGYLHVVLTAETCNSIIKTVPLHLIILGTFKGARPQGCIGNHIHERTDNSISSLEWLDRPLNNTKEKIHPK